jgi:hypothetical protein
MDKAHEGLSNPTVGTMNVISQVGVPFSANINKKNVIFLVRRL